MKTRQYRAGFVWVVLFFTEWVITVGAFDLSWHESPSKHVGLNNSSSTNTYEFYFASYLENPAPWALGDTGFAGSSTNIVHWTGTLFGPGRNLNRAFYHAGVADDSDGDQLSDGFEVVVLKTDPALTDSNTNGTSDAEEDFDEDGLSNLEEYLGSLHGGSSAPWVADTDGDGVSDGPLVPGSLSLTSGPDAFPLDPAASIDEDKDGKPDVLHGVSTSNPPLTLDDFIEILPDLAIFSPTTNYPPAFAAFSPPVSNGLSTALGTPAISEWTRQGTAGDTIMLTGESVAHLSAKVYVPDGVLDADSVFQWEQQAAVTLPTNIPADSMMLVWPSNNSGYGEARRINGTELWWVGLDKVEPGQKFSVFGQNLILGTDSCWLYIEGFGWIKSVSANPYKADFVCPAGLGVGNYSIYAHNGQGRSYGWSEAGQLEVWVGKQFGDNTNTWHNVTDFGLVGDGAFNNQAIFEAMLSTISTGAWPTVYFPDGDYYFKTINSATLAEIRYLSGGVRLIGQSRNATRIIGGDNVSGYFNWSFENDNTVVRDMTLAMTNDTRYVLTAPYQVKNLNGITFSNVLFDATPSIWRKDPIMVKTSENIHFVDCDFNIANPVVLQSNTGVIIEECDFKGMYDVGKMITAGSKQTAYVNNIFTHYDTNDTTSARGWWQARVVSVNDLAQCQIYYGGNESINARTKSPYDHFMSAQPSSISAVDTNNWTCRIEFPVPLARTNLTGSSQRPVLSITDTDGSHRANFGWYVQDYDVASSSVVIRVYHWSVPNKHNDYGPASTNCIISMREDSHANAGEQYLVEGGASTERQTIISATSNSVTCAALNISGQNGGASRCVAVVDGKGMGQMRYIESVAGDTLTVSPDWAVEPGSNSVVVIGPFSYRVAIYDNIFDGVDEGEDDTASSAVQFTAAASGQLVIDSNTADDVEVFFYLNHMTKGSPSQGVNLVSPHFHYLLQNNSVSNSYYYFNHYTTEDSAGSDAFIPGQNLGDSQMFGGIVRNDVVDGALARLINYGTSAMDYACESLLFQDNVYTNLTAFTNASPDHINIIYQNNTVDME